MVGSKLGPEMARHRLDSIDRKILAELQADGRMTNVELARRVKITAPPCLRRVRALEKAGYIKGYHADLDAPSLGYEVTAFAFVGLASQAEGDLRAFEEQARDLPEFQTFITQKLTAAKNVASVKTALAIRASKFEPGIPLEDAP